MENPSEGFILSASPHITGATTTKKIMITVLTTLLPAIIMSALYFGPRVILLYMVAVAGATATEAVVKIIRKKNWRSITDGSAVLTGVLLVMTLPPDVSPVLVLLGSVVAIFIGKEVFGGLGANIFNPALVGRAFLSAAYPIAMTTYRESSRIFPFLSAHIDTASGATPLAAEKFEGVLRDIPSLLLGQTGGSIGETAALFLILGGIVLIVFRIIRWEVVLSYLGTVFIFGGIMHLFSPQAYPSPLFHLFAGGLMLGAFYMATDPVTSPITRNRGRNPGRCNSAFRRIPRGCNVLYTANERCNSHYKPLYKYPFVRNAETD